MLKLTQSLLAEMMGLSVATVCRAEKNRRITGKTGGIVNAFMDGYEIKEDCPYDKST